MADEFQAGKLILSDIGMFNEAMIVFRDVVEPAVLGAVEECVEAFAKVEQWVGGFDLAGDDENCWLAPPQWKIEPDGGEIDAEMWFEISCSNGDDDSWAALLCNQGSSGGEVGFLFGADPDKFGKKMAWNKSFKQINKTELDQVKKLGFKIIENGDGKQAFFLPFHLDAAALADIWGNDGEFSDGDACFEPVKKALEQLKLAVPLFNTIMINWPVKS